MLTQGHFGVLTQCSRGPGGWRASPEHKTPELTFRCQFSFSTAGPICLPTAGERMRPTHPTARGEGRPGTRGLEGSGDCGRQETSPWGSHLELICGHAWPGYGVQTRNGV